MISRSPGWRAARQLAEVGAGVQGTIGGPEQARVAVAFGLGGDPAGQAAQVPVAAWGWRGRCEVRFGLQEPGDGGPVQAAAAA